MSNSYSVHVKGAVPGSDFTLYLYDYPQPIVGGNAPAAEFDFEVPSEFTGEGKIKIFGRAPSRTTQNFAYSIEVKLYNKENQTVNFQKNEPQFTQASQESEQEVISISEPISEEESKSTVEVIKDLTENDLREKIQKKKSGNSFWDNLK